MTEDESLVEEIVRGINVWHSRWKHEPLCDRLTITCNSEAFDDRKFAKVNLTTCEIVLNTKRIIRAIKWYGLDTEIFIHYIISHEYKHLVYNYLNLSPEIFHEERWVHDEAVQLCMSYAVHTVEQADTLGIICEKVII